MHAMLMGCPCINMSGDNSIKHEQKRKEKFTLLSDHDRSLLRQQPGAKHEHPGTACTELHVSEWTKNGLQAHRRGKSMQYRVTTPNSQAGRR